MTVTLRPAVLRDADYVGARMRPIDELESAIALGLTGPEAVRVCLQASPHALAVYDGNPKEPFAVLGVAPLQAPGCGSIWLLGTPDFDEHRKDLIKLTAAFLKECHRHYQTLVIQVAHINTKSIRYLKRFGFKPFPVMDLPTSPLIHLVRTAHV